MADADEIDDGIDPPGLTARQAMFVAEYLVDLNATQAAIRAGYSEKSARQTGADNLKKPYIADEIKRRKRDRVTRLCIDADRVVAETARIAFADIRRIATGNRGGLQRIEELDDDTAAALQSVKITVRPSGEYDGDNPIYEDVIEYKLAPKLPALDALGKHLGLGDDDDPESVADVLRDVVSRLPD